MGRRAAVGHADRRETIARVDGNAGWLGYGRRTDDPAQSPARFSGSRPGRPRGHGRRFASAPWPPTTPVRRRRSVGLDLPLRALVDTAGSVRATAARVSRAAPPRPPSPEAPRAF